MTGNTDGGSLQTNDGYHPKVSVIVPVYNQEKYLRKCLDSLIAQHYDNIEMVCVDDGSTDSSPEILKEYAEKDDRIVIVTKKNGGLSSARNAGMEVMTGEIVSFVDSDDHVHPNIYIHTVPYMERYDYVQMNAFDEKEGEVTSYDLPSEGHTELTPEINMLVRPSVWNKLFKARIIKDHGLLFPVGMNNEDCMFSYAYRSLLTEGYFVNERLYYYVNHLNSITSDIIRKPSEKNFDQLKVLVPLTEFLRRNGRFESFSDQLLRQYVDYSHYIVKLAHGRLRLKAIRTVIKVSKQIGVMDVVICTLKRLGIRGTIHTIVYRPPDM